MERTALNSLQPEAPAVRKGFKALATFSDILPHPLADSAKTHTHPNFVCPVP